MPYREVGELDELTAAEHAELWAGVTDASVALRPPTGPTG